MSGTIIFRLLATPIDDKATSLSAKVSVVRTKEIASSAYIANAADFRRLPGSPYAYWVNERYSIHFQHSRRSKNQG